MEIAQELHAVERQISKMEFYVSQLEEKQAEVIRKYYFEGKKNARFRFSHYWK